MVIKPYQEPKSLQIIRYLDKRMDLPPEGKQLLFNLQKGHEGESRLAELLEDMPDPWLILHDILLEVGNTSFQIDAFLLGNNEVRFFEAKHFDGDFTIESDNWFMVSGKEVQNPFLQLKRSETLFRQFLRTLGVNLPVRGHLIFTHPEFILYQAPLNQPFVLPTQFNRFFRKLKETPSSPSHRMKKLAEKLIEHHVKESPYERLPQYAYGDLKKGIVCAGCGLLTTLLEGRTVVCGRCGHREAAELSVSRSVTEFRILFEDEKLTTSGIFDWCGGVIPKKTISRVLRKHFILTGHGPHSHYVTKADKD